MDFLFLSQTRLFQGMSQDEIQSVLQCLQGKEKHYQKGDTIIHTGQVIRSLGMVLSGSVSIENTDVWGNRTVLDAVSPGYVFGETYACAGNVPLMVNAVAMEETGVLFLNTDRIVGVCGEHCSFHIRLVRNLLSITAQKNLGLSRRIFHTAHKTIRGRLLSFLSAQAQQQGKLSFHISFNRQQLADYLSVDRSALSHEISKMQQEGILTSRKNQFTLLDGSLVEDG